VRPPKAQQEINPTTSGTRRPDRLRRPQDFLAVLREGRRGRHRLLGLAVRCNGLEGNRLGFAVGKRVGTAVVRNRVKRRLREILRAAPLIPGHDIVITAYPEAAGATFDELREATLICARRTRVLDLERFGGDRLDVARTAEAIPSGGSE
jgi:ribonuclease P protein component